MEEFTLYKISYIVIHKDYSKKVTVTGDIALIHLEQKLPVDFEELPILNYERLLDGTRGVVYGFGGHEGWEKWGKWSSYLRYGELVTKEFNCNVDHPLDDLKVLCWNHTDGTYSYHRDSGSM